jgi:hypothetical protein
MLNRGNIPKKENSEMKAIVATPYGSPEFFEAPRYVEAGHKRGNVVITMEQKNIK